MYQGFKGITGLEVGQSRCQDVALFSEKKASQKNK